MYKIIQVKTKKEKLDFINFPLNLYKDVKQFVPPLYMDELNMFTNKNMYKDTCTDVFFLCYKERRVVGRIQGIIQNTYNEINNTKILRFTRFDSINDKEVSSLLFDSLKEWGKEKGLNQIVGPLGYSDLEREGLLIEGFDERQTFEEQYNYPYYQELIESYGFIKDVDWVESELRLDEAKLERIKHAADSAINRYGYKIIEKEKHETKNQFLDKNKGTFFNLLDEGYKKIYGTVPFTEKMKEQVMSEFKYILSPDYIKIVKDKNDNAVAFAIAFPHISDLFVGTKGKLSLPLIIKLIKRVNKPKALDLGLVAVDPDKVKLGAVAPIIMTIVDSFQEHNIEFMETNLNLEDNSDIRNLWNHFKCRQHKRRRSYKLDI